MTGAMNNRAQLAKDLEAFPVRWKPGQRMSELTSLAVGGPADVVVIEDPQCLPDVGHFFRSKGIPWRLLGGGSNLLVRDEGLRSIALQLAPERNGVRFDGPRVEISAAASLGAAVTRCAKNNLGGIAGLVGVPGTVGGALHMNAGAYGTQIGEFVKAVKVFRGSTGEIEVLKPEGIRFEYRQTSFAADDIMLSVTLELIERPYERIVERIKQCNQKRRASQPISEKSAGCIFKNPPGYSTGKMIDDLGMKGLRVGGAMISDRHANFIVNRQEATASDIFRLMDVMRERVGKSFGVELEEEVIVWRESP